MPKYSLLTVLALLCMGIATAFPALADPLKTETTTQAPKLVDPRYYNKLPSDITMGSLDAKVVMIEYSSLSCPHCAHFQKEILPDIKKNYIDTGKVLFIHRDFPLDEPALRAAILAHCAGNDRYYTFIKVLFDKQESWAYQKNFLEILSNIAKLGGISGEKFDSCMKDKALEDAIVETKLTAANTMEITSTPSFFINSKKYSGASNYSTFAKILDEALAAKADNTVKPAETAK